ncbi:SEC10/PgrA surface exclusion domain-containing protein [Streptococcus sp.]|nr:SEC10/PgrA surface exclusion domain-containing protein [Streptococcus sp.]MDY3824855.1 SEC10/PgrA surface exclusion domain-containing protein [Streptococcus sp.]
MNIENQSIDNKKTNKLTTTLATTSATLAVLGASGLNQTVHAEDVETATQVTTTTEETTTQSTPTIEEATVAVADAEKEVATANDAAQQATQAATEQDAVVADLTEQVAEAETAVTAAESAVAEAEIIASESSPEVISETQDKIQAITSELETATTASEVAGQAVQEKEAEAAAANTALQESKDAVSESEKTIATLSEAVQSPEKLAEEKAGSEAKVASLEKEVATADKELEAAKATASTAISTELTQAKTELSEKEAELSQLQTATTEVKSVTGGNTLVVPANYATQLSNIRNYSSISAAAKNELIQIGKAAAAANGVVGDGFVGSSTAYKTIAEDTTRLVDVNNISHEVQVELTQFVVELLNPVRAAFNLSPLTITESSMAFAESVSAAYVSKHSRIQYENGAHDTTILNQEASKAGLTASWYENMGTTWLSSHTTTVDALKSKIYYQLIYMLFTDASSNFGHTRTFLKGDSGEAAYIGVGINGLGATGVSTAFTQHYLVVKESEIQSSGFSRTPIVATKSTVDETKISQVRQEISNLKAKISDLQSKQSNISTYSTVVAAQNKVDTLSAQLSSEKATLSTLTTQLTTATQSVAANQAALELEEKRLAELQAVVVTAQNNFDTVKSELGDLIVAKGAADYKVNTLSEELAATKELLAKYQNENLLAESQEQLAAAIETLETLTSQLALAIEEQETLANQLKEANTQLEAKQATLVAAQKVLLALQKEQLAKQESVIPTEQDGVITEVVLPQKPVNTTGLKPVDTVSNEQVNIPVSEQVAQLEQKNRVEKASRNVLSQTAQKRPASPSVVMSNSVVSNGTKALDKTNNTLPTTGEATYGSASLLGFGMLSAAALASYKRKKDER